MSTAIIALSYVIFSFNFLWINIECLLFYVCNTGIAFQCSIAVVAHIVQELQSLHPQAQYLSRQIVINPDVHEFTLIACLLKIFSPTFSNCFAYSPPLKSSPILQYILIEPFFSSPHLPLFFPPHLLTDTVQTFFLFVSPNKQVFYHHSTLIILSTCQ